MKKNILSLAAVIAAFVFALPSAAQVKFGVKAGLTINSVSLDRDNWQQNFGEGNRAGFFAGVTADVTVPLAGLGADIALLYDNRSIGVGDAHKSLHYVTIPINVKYTLGFSSLASVYAATGPQFSWNVGDRNWNIASYNQGWELRNSEFSWNFGLGATIMSHYRVGYNYNIALGKTAEFEVAGTGLNAVKGKLKNNKHQISLTYIF